MRKLDDIKDFFEYETLKFWIALVIIIILNFLPIYDEAGIAALLFKTLFVETKSIYFLMGLIAVEFIIIIVPFISIQRFLVEKWNLE